MSTFGFSTSIHPAAAAQSRLVIGRATGRYHALCTKTMWCARTPCTPMASHSARENSVVRRRASDSRASSSTQWRTLSVEGMRFHCTMSESSLYDSSSRLTTSVCTFVARPTNASARRCSTSGQKSSSSAIELQWLGSSFPLFRSSRKYRYGVVSQKFRCCTMPHCEHAYADLSSHNVASARQHFVHAGAVCFGRRGARATATSGACVITCIVGSKSISHLYTFAIGRCRCLIIGWFSRLTRMHSRGRLMFGCLLVAVIVNVVVSPMSCATCLGF